MRTVDVPIKDDAGNVIETLVVKRLKRKDLANFIKMQELILTDFVYHNGAVGSLVADENAWANLERIAKLVPVLDGTKEIPFDLSKIEEDYITLGRLFFSTSISDENLDGYDDNFKEVGFKPSLLAQLNQLDYGTLVGKGVMQGREKQKDLMKALLEIQEAATLPETQKLTA